MLTNMADPDFDAHRDLPGLFSQYDPPLHGSFRQAVNPLFRGERFEALAEEAQRLVDERLRALADRAEFDLVQDLAQPVPAGVIFAALGLPRDDWDDLAAWATTYMSALDVDDTLADRGAAEAGQKVGGYLAQLVEERRTDPRPDMITALVNTSVQEGDGHRPLSTTEIAGIASLFVFAGWETTTRLIATTLVHLARDPDARRRVVADPRLVPVAIEEAGRLDPPAQYTGRTTTREVTVRDITIPAGAGVVLLIGSANRDEEVFDRPSAFDLDRTRRSNLTFGFGLHACIGARLARVQAQRAVQALLARWPEHDLDETSLRRARSVVTAGYVNARVTV